MATNPNYQERGIHLGEETNQPPKNEKHPIFTGVKVTLEGGKLNVQGPTVRQDIADGAVQKLVESGKYITGGILLIGLAKQLHII